MTTMNIDSVKPPYIGNVDTGARLKKELIAFWMRHPNGKFTASVISCVLECRRGEARVALDELVREGLIDTYIRESYTYYKLTDDESRRISLLKSSASRGGE